MSDLSNITTAILAGGLGTRLRSVVPDKPKVLAEIAGRPFLTYLLDQLVQAGAKNVVLCTGYKAEMVRDQLGSSYRGLTLHHSVETEPLGTGGAIRLALPALTSATVLVMNGDSYCDANLGQFATWHEEHRSPATLLLTRTDDTRRFGRVDVDDQGRIARFQEKAETTGPGWVNAGLYLLDRARLDAIPAARAVSIERELFPTWIGRGLHGYCSAGKLWDIGVPDAYAQADSDFLRRPPS